MSWSIAHTAFGMAPDSLPEPIAVASLIAGYLNRIGVSYVIGGSLASSVHGEPRSTNDIDMVVDLRAGDVDAFIDAADSVCYLSRDAIMERPSRLRSLPIFVRIGHLPCLRPEAVDAGAPD